MLKLISAIETIHIDFINALLYGEPGIGKTTLAFTANKPFLLNFDGNGLGRASFRADAGQPDSWEDVIAFQESKAIQDYETLIIDTVGNMIDVFIKNYVKKISPKFFGAGGEISLKGYGAMRNIFDNFNIWAREQKLNVIYIAHATEERLQNNTKMVPDITGGSYDIIRRSMDLIGYYSSVNDMRIIDFSPRDSHIGKDCANIGSVAVPADNSESFKTFMAGIIEKTVTRMNSLTDNQMNAVKKIYSFEELLVNLTVEKCTEFGQIVNSEPDRNIQLQMRALLLKKASEAGIIFDIKTKKFIKNV
jgi:hypothetical protein